MDEYEEFILYPDLGFDQFVSFFPDVDVSYFSEEIRIYFMDYDFSQSAWKSADKNSSVYQSRAYLSYQRLSQLNRKDLIHKNPMLALVLVESLIILSALFDAHLLVHELCLQYPDVVPLAMLSTRLSNFIKRDQEDDELDFQCCDLKLLSDDHEATIDSILYSPPPTPLTCNLEYTSEYILLLNRWESIQDQETCAIDLFQRITCIDSNILEGVFSLNGNSYNKLIRQGISENSIESLSIDSKTKDKNQVVRILNNTINGLEQMSNILDDFTCFSCDFIINLHQNLLMNDNFDKYEIEDSEGYPYDIYVLIATGRFRNKSISTRHKSTVVKYCNKNDVDRFMKKYVELACDLLKDDSVDPFIKCAWLQWTFLIIHPFEDGNGRISRIISSIPLLKMNLPPVVVFSDFETKQQYFDCLQLADENGDITPLADFLRDQVLKGITLIEQLPSAEDLDENPR